MKKNVFKRRIMWGDLDPLGIVFYPKYYRWMDDSAQVFLKSMGLNMVEVWKDRNVGFILVETSCRYFSPGKYLQDIEIRIHIDELGEKTLNLKYLITDAAKNSLMVEGIEKRICIDTSDPQRFKAIPIPKDMREILRSAMNG